MQEVYLINEQTKAVDAKVPVGNSGKDNDLEFLQTPDGTNCSYIVDIFSIQALYKGNFGIIFYADNPYTNNEEDYLKLSVWSFRGKTKSVLNNYLRDMTTNYKTGFLLPHNYEIPTFNYPQYVLPPIPYNYKQYTKDIMPSGAALPLKTKIIVNPHCINRGNLFLDNLYDGYYETEIDLRQIDPTIQSISKFISSYKTIEISNLNNLQVECGPPEIENFIPDRNVNLIAGANSCNNSPGLLSNAVLKKYGLSQNTIINFDNTITLYTDNITNDIQTVATAFTNGLASGNYHSIYWTENNSVVFQFLLQISDDKIKETYLQAYYTNDVKLKIRFIKKLKPELRFLGGAGYWPYFGNEKYITIDVSNPNVLGIRNKNDNPVKIKFKPR